MKTCMLFLMTSVIMSAYGADKKSEGKDKRPKPIDIAVANAKSAEKPKSPSDTTEVPKKEGDERPGIYSHTTTYTNWGTVKKQQDKT